MRIIIITYLFLYSWGVKSQSQLHYSYEEALLNFNYSKAFEYSDTLDKGNLFPYLRYITQLKRNSGQSPSKDKQIYLKLINNVDNESPVLYNYTLATYYFYNDISSDKTFYYLSEAYKSLSQKDFLYEKLVLLSFCDLYSIEIVQSSKEYLIYLNKYKKIAKSPIEIFWYHYHINKYKSKENGITIQESISNFPDFQTFFVKNKFNNDINLHYYYFEALSYRLQKKDTLAIKSYEKVIDLGANKPYAKYFTFTSLIHLANLYSNKKEYNKAKNSLQSAYKYWNHSDSIRSRFIQNRFTAFNYYERINKYDSAYLLLKESIKDEYLLDFRKNTLKTSELNVNLQTAEKEKTIAEKEKENLEQKAKTQQISTILGSTLLLGSIIAFLVYRNTKRKQRIAEQDRELQIQKTETILKEKELETINAMISGQEKERLRIAGELHDNIGSTLAMVRIQVENLERNLDKIENPKVLLHKTNDLVNKAYKKVRTLSHERNSGVLAKDGLLPAIRKLARTVSSNNNLQVDVQDFGLEDRIANELEITIFRIIQELVTNIIKHAQATEANISLTQHDNELNIMVEDNGKGFKVGRLKEKDGMGLGNIERRVEHMEGTMEVDSTPGRGTHITIDIPL